MDTCRHVTRLKPSLDHSILNPQKWLCTDCGTTESVWACLSCANAACGRYNEEHAVKHYKETKHPLAIEVNDKYVFCYVCDEYVLNDNAAGDIKILRSALGAIATQSFDDIEGRSRGRILRSNSYHGFSNNRIDEELRLRKQDLTFTVLKFRRYYLLARVFAAWKHYVDTYKKLKKRSLGTKRRASPSLRDSPQVGSPPSAKKKRAIIPGAVGLRNLGNTCYMNSVLQVLSHLPDFRDYCLGLKGMEPAMSHLARTKSGTKLEQSPNFMRQSTMECFQYLNSDANKRGGLNGGGSSGSSAHKARNMRAAKANMSLCQELHALFRVLWSGKWALVSPHKMLVAVWSIIPFFKGYSQQDAQEFLCELLDKVEGELFRMFPVSNPTTSQAGTVSAPTPPQAGTSRSMQRSDSCDPDIVNKLFQGQLVSEVKCLVCGNKSRTYEPFMDLSLEFPSRYQISSTSQRTCDIEEMLSKFTETEKLDGKIYSCEQCNKNRPRSAATLYTEAEKQFHINKLPRVLRLHLKRFMWSGRNHRGKISLHVQFRDTLDMEPYCHLDNTEHSYTYRLSSVVMHHGRGFGSGHYTAYCWNSEADSWLHCNDSRVQQCLFSDVMRSQAYILFYTKVETTPVVPRRIMRTLSSDFEEAVDDDIVFNYQNSNIPRFVELKRRLSTDTDPTTKKAMKRTRSNIW